MKDGRRFGGPPKPYTPPKESTLGAYQVTKKSPTRCPPCGRRARPTGPFVDRPASVLQPPARFARGRAHVRLSLLLGFELRCDGEPLTLPLSAQRLLAFVALQERAVHRLYVASTLWIDSTEEAANASL